MATSGVTIWQLTRDEIITKALQKVGAIADGATASSTQIADAATYLNAIVSEFQVLGMQLWSREEYMLTLVSGTQTYTLGVGQTIDIPFPLKLVQANLLVASTGSRINLEIKAHYDFNNLPTTSAGQPVAVMYQPFINYGVLSVWPTPDASVPAGTIIALTYQRPFDIYTSGTETAYFPQEWSNALIFTLAHVISDDYGLPLADRQWLEKQSDKHIATASSQGPEEASMFFFPDKQGGK